jgi:outer membrane protein assembly factor BamD (BamD/ComL family)
MKKAILIFSLLILGCGAFAVEVNAQKKSEKQQISPIEMDAFHNLEVAEQYFIKKRHKAVLLRLEETMAAHPEFSRMDEVLYFMGMSSFYMAEGKTKQPLAANASEDEKKRFAPEKLREDALAYLSMLVEKYPNSKRVGDAQKTIKELESKTTAAK